jgi:hypothetical protein
MSFDFFEIWEEYESQFYINYLGNKIKSHYIMILVDRIENKYNQQF